MNQLGKALQARGFVLDERGKLTRTQENGLAVFLGNNFTIASAKRFIANCDANPTPHRKK